MPEEIAFRLLFINYRKGAQKRGLSFDLDDETFRRLTKEDCFYCGQPPAQVATYRQVYKSVVTVRGSYIYNGIDRRNSKLGYVDENCVSCCGQCNRAKSDMSFEDFMSWIARLSKNINLHT